MRSTTRVGLALFTNFLVSSALVAQPAKEIQVKNWVVPQFEASVLRQSAGGITPLSHTLGDVPAVFVPFGPCRLSDTRFGIGGPMAPIGTAGAGGERAFDEVPAACPTIAGLQDVQTVDAGVVAFSLNFTVVNTLGAGFLYAYDTGGTAPATAILNYTGAAGELRNNAAIVPVSAAGSFTVGTGVRGADVIIDTNGVFVAPTLEDGVQLRFVGNTAGQVFLITQTGTGHGIWGETASTTTGFAGIVADGDGATGVTYGLFADLDSTTNCAAGVLGRAGGNALQCAGNFSLGPFGVLGTNSLGPGVMGLSALRGVQGSRTDAIGNPSGSGGVLGYTGTSGVHSFQDVTAAGAKPFIEPHPHDASKQIKFVSLEGNEVGTYFRGKARFQRGTATIEVPEGFRMVTEPEGLSIQVTPIGEMATYAVVSINLDRIVVKGSRNVEFFYTVNGIRHNYANFKSIEDNIYFIPANANDVMSEWPETHRRILVQNGTLKPDGTVNLETAGRLGWEKIWEKEKLRVQAEMANQSD